MNSLFSDNSFVYIYFIHLFFLQAVEESLKSVNLFYHGVADKQAGKYSGGMKRRLSVAISLIGDPQVCSVMFLFSGKNESYQSIKYTTKN